MQYKWIGAILVTVGCGGFGFSLANAYRREEGCFQNLLYGLRFMESELRYQLTPLPELCRRAGKEMSGVLRGVFLRLSRELERQLAPDAASCMAASIDAYRDQLPPQMRRLLRRLGKSLGRFDLNGQLQGLAAVEDSCRRQLEDLRQNRDIRLRNYRTLGICAGIALAILFI